VTTAMNLIES